MASIAQRVALPDPAVEVWLVPLKVAGPHLEHCLAPLSRDEQARAGRFQFEQDRRRYIVARGMLRVLLGNNLGVAPAAIEFKEGQQGKPYVAAPTMPVHFNLSHAAEFALYAISRVCVPGVDIEYLDRDLDYEGIAQRFFSVREHAQLQRISAAERKRAFLACWTRKEAVLKATGDGLRVALNQVEVTIDADTPPQLLNIPGGRISDWALHTVDAGSAYVATVALHRAT